MSVETLAAKLTALEDNKVNPLTVISCRRPLTSPHSYYRSQYYTAETDINPLIQAAAPLLTIAGQLRHKKLPDLIQLHQELLHEMKAFEHLAQNFDYRAPTVLAARYALCCLLDETVSRRLNVDQEQWQKQSLLFTFQQEYCGKERFFMLLERSLEDPKQHIDLLELFYLCLRYDYQGKYAKSTNGHIQLQKISDNLYHAIRYQRGEFSKQLLLNTQSKKHKSRKKSRWSLTIMIITILLAGAGIYGLLQHQLDNIITAML